MGAKHIGRISLLISLLVVITLSSATADNIALTQKEISILEPDTIGLLNGGIRIAEIIKSDHPDGLAVIKTDVSFFNTMDESVTLDIIKEQFWEEREHTIKENYTFYFIPNLDWVKTPNKITIEPMSKYVMPVTIEMPIDEGFSKSKGGGFICMISASRGGEEAYGHKLFLMLKEKKEAEIENSFFSLNLDDINPIYLLSLVAVVGVVVVAVVLKKRKSQYYDDEGYYDDEYYDEEAETY